MTKPKDISFYKLTLNENPEPGTRFIPEPPFSEYKRGRVYINIDERRTIDLRDSNQSAMTLLVSRYLFQVDYWKKYRKLIPDGYEVDHIDDDKTNDTLINLQLLTKSENIAKRNRTFGVLWSFMICPVCRSTFAKLPGSNQINPNYKGYVFCCSNRCTDLLNATLMPVGQFQDLKIFISENQIWYNERHWKHLNKKEVEDPVNEVMLNFDLEKESGKAINYDSLNHQPFHVQIQTVKKLREDGLLWEQIAEKCKTTVSYLYSALVPHIKTGRKTFQEQERLDKQADEIVRLRDIEHLMFDKISEIMGLSARQCGAIYNQRHDPNFKPTKKPLSDEAISRIKVIRDISTNNPDLSLKEIANRLNRDYKTFYAFYSRNKEEIEKLI